MDISVARLGPEHLPGYKALRDEALLYHPESFNSDPETERRRSPESYLGRLGLNEPLGGSFLLGAWANGEMVGTVGCAREIKPKLRHRANLVGLYVRESQSRQGIGRRLLTACIDLGRQARGLEMLTLSVTASSEHALRLYQAVGFEVYGVLPRAVRLETGRNKTFYADKTLMVLSL